MFSLIDALTSIVGLVAAGLSIAALLGLWFMWRSYFTHNSDLKLSIATLLGAISIGVTSVSILLPTTGALLLYYLSRISEGQLATASPLVVVLFWLGSSMCIGIWNAFSLATQNPGGEYVTWKRGQIGHALFFATQGVLFVVGVIILVFFFVATHIDVRGLLKQP